jgi:hypothetical protein
VSSSQGLLRRSGRPTAGEGLGRVEYRLARNSVVREFRRGRLSRSEVCDAQPELLRVARNLGEPTSEDCPICAESKVVHVSFAFGPKLPPSGRCLGSSRELGRLARRVSETACYVVEVCPECSWNHLARMFVVGGREKT